MVTPCQVRDLVWTSSCIMLLSAGFAFAGARDNCVNPPGVPDRPCSSAEVLQPYYRTDQSGAVASTGNPQLLVFWNTTAGYYGCSYCALARPILQQLEAEYWGRINFIYLDANEASVAPVMER